MPYTMPTAMWWTPTPGGINTEACIAGDKVCSDLEELADDDDVKAVVLRVNSGGGSAYASEQIWHAVTKLRERKPVVVSMGAWPLRVATTSLRRQLHIRRAHHADRSIGIFGMFPNAKGLTDKIGVNLM